MTDHSSHIDVQKVEASVPKQLKWTPALIARFWNGVEQIPALQELSFARVVGPALLELMAPWIRDGSACLDYGSGDGHLASLLCAQGIQTTCFEPSEERARAMSERLGEAKNFLGAIAMDDPSEFDFVICTEVIEHVPVPETDIFMSGLLRRIKLGGRLFLTTPFNEDLGCETVYCPHCEHTFHRWQHQRNWSCADIKTLMERWGLETEWIGVVGFTDIQVIRDFHLRRRLGEPWPHTVVDESKKRWPRLGQADRLVFVGKRREPNLPDLRPLLQPQSFQNVTMTDTQLRERVSHAIMDTFPRAWERLRSTSMARRVQPWIDHRKTAIHAALTHPGDFPYRMNHFNKGRVLLAIGGLYCGGAERQMLNTLEGLRARGIENVHLLVEHLDEGTSNTFYLEKAREVAASIITPSQRAHGTHPWALKFPGFRSVLTDGMIDRVLNRAEIIRRLAPEVVQISLDWTNITVGLAAVLAGVPRILISGRNVGPQHFIFFQWFMYPCYQALAALPNVHFLNNSEAGRDDYAAWLGLPKNEITVLYNGLHTQEFARRDANERLAARAELGIGPNAKVVAGAFRFASEKRPLLWLNVAARILQKMPETIFLLSGEGDMREVIETRARRLGLGDNLRLLGARRDIHNIFAAADLVMQTSLQEGTPNTLIEAQAMGIPVVTTPACGAAEAVEDGVTGFVVRQENASAIARASVSILRDPQFQVHARENGPVFVEKRFGFERMIDDTLIAYAKAGIDWAVDFLPDEKKWKIHLPLRNLHVNAGLCWQIHLPDLRNWSDGENLGTKSPLLILENGRPIGIPHQSHSDIRNLGGGRYSHWHDWLYFSSPDGSNLAKNGRDYAAVIPWADTNG